MSALCAVGSYRILNIALSQFIRKAYTFGEIRSCILIGVFSLVAGVTNDTMGLPPEHFVFLLSLTLWKIRRRHCQRQRLNFNATVKWIKFQLQPAISTSRTWMVQSKIINHHLVAPASINSIALAPLNLSRFRGIYRTWPRVDVSVMLLLPLAIASVSLFIWS